MCQGEFILTRNWKNPVENGVLFSPAEKTKIFFLIILYWQEYIEIHMLLLEL